VLGELIKKDRKLAGRPAAVTLDNMETGEAPLLSLAAAA